MSSAPDGRDELARGEVVLDTSVALKWFLTDEPGAAEAARYLDGHGAGDITLIAPAILPVELANVLRYSGLPREGVLEVVSEFGLAHIELYEASAGRLRDATEVAFDHGLSLYDALFLALAHERTCPLLTADRKAFGRVHTKTEIRLL